MGMQPVFHLGVGQVFWLGCLFVPVNATVLSDVPRRFLAQRTALQEFPGRRRL